ncbi:MAG: efflux RND transporter periplasmic adaptor subunit [Bacteroidetes bacterium]|nr:MAG: efflux RND transporter periplasmic adaptor subunit [Bacteroidota bacterium]
MKKYFRIIIFAVIFILIIGFIGFQSNFFGGNKSISTEKNATPNKNKETFVRAIIIKHNSLDNRLRVTGSIIANEEVTITSEISGMITQINFQEGTNVAKGAMLVKINDADLKAQFEKLTFREELFIKREFRQKKLLEKGGVSQDEYDTGLAELNALKAEKRELEAKIAKTQVLAPFSGTIGLRQISQGAYINAGTSIAKLVNTDKLKVEFSVPEKYIMKLKNGQKCIIKFGENETKYEANIYAIEPKLNINTRTLTAKAWLNSATNDLKPGAFVKVEIIWDTFEKAIEIPTYALIPDIDAPKIYQYKNGKAVNKIVKIGIRSAETVQIEEGIAENDTIIISGIMNLRPNIPVKLLEVK